MILLRRRECDACRSVTFLGELKLDLVHRGILPFKFITDAAVFYARRNAAPPDRPDVDVLEALLIRVDEPDGQRVCPGSSSINRLSTFSAIDRYPIVGAYASLWTIRVKTPHIL